MDFKSSIEDIDTVTKQIKVSIPADTVTTEFNSALNEVAGSAQMKGFRAGKAPRHLVEKMHGQRIRLEVANRLISSSLHNVVRENKIDMVGSPEIDVASFEPGKEIEYTAQISIFPRPEIAGYEQVAVSAPRGEVTDKDVDGVVERMREVRATPRKLEFRNTAQKGDVVDASLLVELEGEEPTRPEPLVVGLGEGRIPAELEEGIVGMEVGTAKEIVVTVPDDHQNKQMAGKKVTYKVTLNSLSEKVLPELTDDFVKSLNLEPKTILELRVQVRKDLEAQSEREAKEAAHMAILDELMKRNDFQVPQVIIDDEIRSMLVRNNFIDPQKTNPESISMEPFRERLGEMALKRVRSALVVDRIAEKENIRASEEDLQTHIAQVAEQNQLPLEEVRKFFMNAERKMNLLVELTRTRVLDFLLDKAAVTWTKPAPVESKPGPA